MTENSTDPPVHIEYVVVEKPQRRWYKRPGCILGLVIWLILILTPTFFIVVAVQGDITINHTGDIPDKGRYPRFQVKLIMEPDYRGFSITNSSINRDDESLCIEQNVNYVLWQGSGEAATFCQCYTRDIQEGEWVSAETITDSCP